MIDPNNSYTEMQRRIYDAGASRWSLANKDHVVGSFDGHNNWEDYELLFAHLDSTHDKIMLDFGCGPGRNIVKYHDRFARIDGADISPINLEKAQLWAQHNGINPSTFNLYATNGLTLEPTPSHTYDVVMSVICFQHIPVHEIRYSLMQDIFRVLKPGGTFTAQMGYGPDKTDAFPYHSNNYHLETTNGNADVRVESPEQLSEDLYRIGFTSFNYSIRPVGPGDNHSNWIFFNAST